MHIAKIYRAGNSRILAIPREFEKDGYVVGQRVLITLMDDGNLLLTLEEREENNIRADYNCTY